MSCMGYGCHKPQMAYAVRPLTQATGSGSEGSAAEGRQERPGQRGGGELGRLAGFDDGEGDVAAEADEPARPRRSGADEADLPVYRRPRQVGLMRNAVRSGAAHEASLPGTPVYGQVGLVRTGSTSWTSWFVGFRGNIAFTVIESGRTSQLSAAALAGAFLSALGS